MLAAHPQLGNGLRMRVAGIIEELGGSRIASRLAGAHGLSREVPFAFMRGDAVVSGRMDALADEDGRALVIDYKTGSGVLDSGTLEERYRLQMDIYALALLLGGHSEVEVAVVALENKSQCTNGVYFREDVGRLQDELGLIVAEIHRPGQSWPRTGDAATCRTCGLRRFCGPSAPPL